MMTTEILFIIMTNHLVILWVGRGRGAGGLG